MKSTQKQILAIRKEMRKHGAFTKYCSKCKQIIASDDIDEFIEKVKNHSCTKEMKKGDK